MRSDAFFVKGQSHDICQDYAKSFGDLITVSDGCSVIRDGDKCIKHPSSDVAARILCWEASMSKGSEDFLQHLKFTSKAYNLSLDATLLSVKCLGPDSIYLYWYGDGAVCIEYKDGLTQVAIRHYDPNMPLYVSYLINDKQMLAYLNHAPKVTDKNTLYKTWTKIEDLNRPPILPGLIQGVKSISLFSDGIGDIYTPNGKLDTIKAIEALTSFKRTNGEFVLARMKAQLREWASKNIYPNDDLSMATLILE